jgi:hypothetical protein
MASWIAALLVPALAKLDEMTGRVLRFNLVLAKP